MKTKTSNPEWVCTKVKMLKIRLLMLTPSLSFISLAQNTTNRSSWGNSSVLETLSNSLIKSRHDLMAKYAPVIIQEVATGSTVLHGDIYDGEDMPLAVDFDKNWNSFYTPWDGNSADGSKPSGSTATSRKRDDNSYNVTEGNWTDNDQTPTVYGQFFETNTYWIMRYNLYHSYNRVLNLSVIGDLHKNDGEWIQLFVEKSSGKVTYAQTVHHGGKPIVKGEDILFDGTHGIFTCFSNGKISPLLNHGHAISSYYTNTFNPDPRGIGFYPAMNRKAPAIPHNQSMSGGWKIAGAPSHFLTGNNSQVTPSNMRMYKNILTYNLVPYEEVVAKWRAPEKQNSNNSSIKTKLGISSGPTSWGGKMFEGAWLTYDNIPGVIAAKDLKSPAAYATAIRAALGSSSTYEYDVRNGIGTVSSDYIATDIGGVHYWPDLTNFYGDKYANIAGGGKLVSSGDKFTFFRYKKKANGITAMIRNVGNQHLIDGYNANPENEQYVTFPGATGGLMVRKDLTATSDFIYVGVCEETNYIQYATRINGQFSSGQLTNLESKEDTWLYLSQEGQYVKLYYTENYKADNASNPWQYANKQFDFGGNNFHVGMATLSNVPNSTDKFYWNNAEYDYIGVRDDFPSGSPFKAHWKLNETSGSTAADASGHGNTGTLHDNASWAVGRDGNSILLNASGSGDYVSVPSMTLTGDFTIAGWVKLAPGITNADALVGNNGNGDDINFNDSKPGMYFHGIGTIGTSAVTIQPDVWTHVAYTRSGIKDANNTYNVHLYVNGVEYTTSPGTNHPFSFNAIGAGKLGAQTKGSIDDVRVYTVAKTASEIKTWAGFRDLEAYWTFDQSSTILEDVSGNGHHGSVNGGSFVAGKYGNAYKMDRGDYIIIDEIGLGGDFTIAGWVKFEPGFTNTEALIGNDGTGDDINFYNSRPGMYIQDKGTISTTSAANISPNTWTHVAYTRSGIKNNTNHTHNVHLYVNGIEYSTSPGTNEPFIFKTIGAGYQGVTTKGVIDELRAYNTAKTQSQINAIMNNAASARTSNTKETLAVEPEEEAIINSISLYPNPATDAFSFTIPTEFKQSSVVNVSISDLSGKVVQSATLQNDNTNDLSVKTNTLSNGLYFVKIAIDNTSVTKKLLINR